MIKWKDLPEDENEWVADHDFDSTEIIDDYNQKINQENNINLFNNYVNIKEVKADIF